MWDFLTKMVPTFMDFARGTKKNSDKIEALDERVEVLAEAVRTLELRQESAETRQQHTEERHKAEMRELLLRLEIILLRHGINPNFPENQLPEPPQNDAS